METVRVGSPRGGRGKLPRAQGARDLIIANGPKSGQPHKANL